MLLHNKKVRVGFMPESRIEALTWFYITGDITKENGPSTYAILLLLWASQSANIHL